MDWREKPGVCPSCGESGDVGAACGRDVCSRRGYHFVPADAFDPDAGPPDPILGLMIDEYLVVGLIGAGAFGRVYLGVQLAVGLEVAIKLLAVEHVPSGLLPSLREKFESEARALSMLQHPNAVRIFKYGELYDRPLMVMEYVRDGVTLGEEIDSRVGRGEGFSPAELRRLLAQLLDGLEAAHERGIIHRDIKPDNLMLQRVRGDELFVRILDFGLAKFFQSSSETRQTSGTPDYMAPEQLTMENLGPWTDLYAAGAIAFELFCGRKPFGGRGAQTTFFYKMQTGYDPLSGVADLSLPAEVESFLRRALAHSPEDRYRSAALMRAELSSALDALEVRSGWPAGGEPLIGLVGGDRAARAPTRRGGGRGEKRSRRRESDDAFERWLSLEQERISSVVERSDGGRDREDAD
jgi:serine/threonine protein kinase